MIRSVSDPERYMSLKFPDDDQGRGWEAVRKELMSMLELWATLVGSERQRKGGKVEK